jgi:hypothetical protein
MGMLKIAEKLASIDRECNKDDELKKRLEPWVIKMNTVKPRTKKEAEVLANRFISEYEKIKEEIKKDIASEQHGL